MEWHACMNIGLSRSMKKFYTRVWSFLRSKKALFTGFIHVQITTFGEGENLFRGKGLKDLRSSHSFDKIDQ